MKTYPLYALLLLFSNSVSAGSIADVLPIGQVTTSWKPIKPAYPGDADAMVEPKSVAIDGSQYSVTYSPAPMAGTGVPTILSAVLQPCDRVGDKLVESSPLMAAALKEFGQVAPYQHVERTWLPSGALERGSVSLYWDDPIAPGVYLYRAAFDPRPYRPDVAVEFVAGALRRLMTGGMTGDSAEAIFSSQAKRSEALGCKSLKSVLPAVIENYELRYAPRARFPAKGTLVVRATDAAGQRHSLLPGAGSAAEAVMTLEIVPASKVYLAAFQNTIRLGSSPMEVERRRAGQSRSKPLPERNATLDDFDKIAKWAIGSLGSPMGESVTLDRVGGRNVKKVFLNWGGFDKSGLSGEFEEVAGVMRGGWTFFVRPL